MICLLNRSKLTCTICGYVGKKGKFNTLKSHCIFVKKDILRHICPECGLIFGTQVFLTLPRHIVSYEYANLYRQYSEGDTTEFEIRTFESLMPFKGGCYLNFGSGLWSKTITRLRSEGWNVYGYEPYAKSEKTKDDYTITSLSQLKKMRFDGIFSHNVIEHLFDPVYDFQLMKSLLRDSDSKMSHSTPCYEYKYDFSIFHVHFYTGDSLLYLLKKINMQTLSHIKDNNTEYDCYVFGSNQAQAIPNYASQEE